MKKISKNIFDLIVIGGGSGGVRAARIAAEHGAKVALCEKDRMGGTCVIRGCIPKKLLFYSSEYNHLLKNSNFYGWKLNGYSYDLNKMIKNKDKELLRLEKLYEKNAIKSGVKIIYGEAKFKDKNTIIINDKTLIGKKIIIAVGGTPIKLDVPGSEYALDSELIMQIKKIPKKLVIIGAGYIAIEFAFIFSGLGAKVSLIVRNKILRGFDYDLVNILKDNLLENKVKVYMNEEVKSINKYKNNYKVLLKNSKLKINAEKILYAIGRKPNLKNLNVEKANIKCDKKDAIIVNRKLATNIKNIYAIGDVTDRVNLTPVAIAEGHALSENLFNKKKYKEINIENIGTAVFSLPPICSIGLTEIEAKLKYKNLHVYESKFNSLKYSIVKKKKSTYIKLLVNANNNRLIGAHMLGDEAPEIIQIVGVAMNAKATIDDFINTMAIHPTVAEELVTFKGLSRKYK